MPTSKMIWLREEIWVCLDDAYLRGTSGSEADSTRSEKGKKDLEDRNMWQAEHLKASKQSMKKIM